MSAALTPGLQRILAVGLLALAAALLASLTVAPLAGAVRAQVGDRRLLEKEAAKLQGLVDAEPELRSVTTRIDAHPMWQRIYRGASREEAETALQKDFRSLAEEQGISLDTLQPTEAAKEQDFTRIGVRVGFNTSIDHLAQLLAAIQAAPHFMRFENLYVTSPMVQSGAGNPPLVVRGDAVAYAILGAGP